METAHPRLTEEGKTRYHVSKELFWYCSEDCYYPGPWRSALTRCVTCEHDRCQYCKEKWFDIRDGVPITSTSPAAHTQDRDSDTLATNKHSQSTSSFPDMVGVTSQALVLTLMMLQLKQKSHRAISQNRRLNRKVNNASRMTMITHIVDRLWKTRK
jgi:hypothetical protein